MSFENGVLEGSGLDFGGPETRFRRVLKAPRLDFRGFGNDFFKILGQNAKKAKNAKNACQNKSSITNAPRVGGRRCSPPGGFQLWKIPLGRKKIDVCLFERLENSEKVHEFWSSLGGQLSATNWQRAIGFYS